LTRSLNRVPLQNPHHLEAFYRAVDGLRNGGARAEALADRSLHFSVGPEELLQNLSRISQESVSPAWEAKYHLDILTNRRIFEPEILDWMARRLITLLHSAPLGYESFFIDPLEKIVLNPVFTDEVLERIRDQMAIFGMSPLRVFTISERLHRARYRNPRFEN